MSRTNAPTSKFRPAAPGGAPGLGLVLDKLRQGVCVFDGAHRLVLFNRRYGEIYGLAPGALRLGMSLREIVDLRHEAGSGPAMSPGDYTAWRDSIAVQNRPIESVARLRNGRVIEIYHEPTREGGWVATHDDVTGRVRAEEALREKTDLLDATLGAMDQGLQMFDAGGVLRVSNPRASALLTGAAGPGAAAPAREVEGAGGTVLEVTSVPMADGGEVRTLTDVTARRAAERRVARSEARLRALTDALPQMIWLTGADGDAITYRNAGFDAFHGPIGPGFADRLATYHPEDARRMARARAESFATGEAYAVEGRLRRHDGLYRWHKLVKIPVLRDGALMEWIGTALDIDDIVAVRDTLRLSEERLALALDAGSDGLWDLDAETGETWYSSRWASMLGYAPGELDTDARTWRELLHPEDRTRALEGLREHLKGRTPAYESEHRLRRPDGSWTWVLTRGKVVARGPDGRARRLVGTAIDVSERKAAEARIAHMARHDALTDLPNRTLLAERLTQRLAELRRYGGSCALLCLDLDRFKLVNDTLGHHAGDALLREVAARLRAAVRAEDTVARLGGDEFAVLLARPGEPSDIAGLAERLIAAVGEPVRFGAQDVRVGLSLGIALAPAQGEDGETLMRRADLALYRAKEGGKNRACFFEASMDEAAAARRRLELDLRQAIARNELKLHYQPQVTALTGELVGFEALVRWEHPERGIISPADFIPIAEETGLIGALGEWVLDTAAREAAGWTRPLKVAVNLSPLQFQQPDLPERILAILARSGLSPARLELEITESVIINDMARALTILRRLKAIGIRIAMDDFGTGYSSLATLQAFPFDKIKIDRSFVSDMEARPQAAVIVRAVLGLGRSLGMGVVAEGVETSDQLRFLAAESCDEVQGYLIGKPRPIEQFRDAMGGREAPAADAAGTGEQHAIGAGGALRAAG